MRMTQTKRATLFLTLPGLIKSTLDIQDNLAICELVEQAIHDKATEPGIDGMQLQQ